MRTTSQMTGNQVRQIPNVVIREIVIKVLNKREETKRKKIKLKKKYPERKKLIYYLAESSMPDGQRY